MPSPRGGVPPTPFPWSFDLSEDEAAAKLESCPAVLIVLEIGLDLHRLSLHGSEALLGHRVLVEGVPPTLLGVGQLALDLIQHRHAENVAVHERAHAVDAILAQLDEFVERLHAPIHGNILLGRF